LPYNKSPTMKYIQKNDEHHTKYARHEEIDDAHRNVLGKGTHNSMDKKTRK